MTLPLAGLGIAITRPPEQGHKLSAAITAAGGQVISFPLLDIVGLEDLSTFDRVIRPLDQFHWVIFISSNAVQYGMPGLQQAGIPSTLQFAAIGPVTASALQTLGVQQVLTPAERFDSESLLALPQLQSMQGQRVLIIRGVGGREVLAETLSQRGAEVVFGECYRRVNPQTSDHMLDMAYQAGQLHGVVITSSEALRFLLDLAGQSGWLKTVPLFVNHARIAEQAAAHGLVVFSADQPGDVAMLDLLQAHLQHP